MRAVKNAPVRHRIEHALYLGVKTVLRALPHRASRSLGAVVGNLGHALDRRHRQVALDNVAIAFPELSPAERADLVRRCFRHFGSALCEAISADRFSYEEFCEHFTFEGWEHVEAAESLGKGLFVLGSHMGYWEFSARPIGLYRGTIHTVARPADNPHLDRELVRLRERFGYAVVPKHGAARRMLQLLKQGERIGILVDQRVQEREGIQVPFFGRPAWTTPVLARLSLRSGAPVLPVFAYAEPKGRYRFVAHPPIAPPEGARDDEEVVTALTRRYLEATEEEIRRHPEQWLWMHRRWDKRKQAH